MRLLLLLPFVLLCLFHPASAYDDSELEAAGLYEEFDPDRLTFQEKKFLQAGLAFKELYKGQIDGVWGPGSQEALERFSEKLNFSKTPENKILALPAFWIAGITENILLKKDWNYEYLNTYKISVLIPERNIKFDGMKGSFYAFNDEKTTLRYRITRENHKYKNMSHDLLIDARKKGTKPYTVRKRKLWITSARNQKEVTFYVRSDFIGGSWTTIIVSSLDSDAGALAAVAGSITPREMPQLRLGDGYLRKGIDAARQVLRERERKKQAAEDIGNPDTRLPDEGSASTPDTDTPPLAKGSAPKTASSGTGFAVSANGDLLTNNHVAGDCSRLTVDGHKASLMATDETFDLALLQVPALRNEDFATFAESPAPLNSDITVAGYPLSGLLSGLNVTRGSVTAMKGIGGDSTRMQISAPVQPGNSGGPAMNAYGHVVGVVAAKLDAQRVADAIGDIPQNVNFAVRGSMAKLFLHQNGITPKTAAPKAPLSPEAIATRLTAITHFIECY
ncbi:serine protease [uncultured Roseibium sp.]|uniref:S1C family serine protease n=1 Tax=uncultured Roseibium sp. TaxID=1936171 RepID=UPI00321806E7